MTPNFALTLSSEGLGLLHRVPTGWHLVGNVPFDAEDMPRALTALRESAVQLDPDGLSVKLVLPEDQIKYLAVPTQGTTPDKFEALAHKAIDGATPYALNELAVDWSEQDGQLYVAAVARETLAEAEAFAHEHQFNPVSFVAQPPNGTFVGEPFFGGTHIATELFGGPVTPDKDPIKLVGLAGFPDPKPESNSAPEPEPAKETPLIEEIGVPSFDVLEAHKDVTPPLVVKAPNIIDAPDEPEDYEAAARLAEAEMGPAMPLTPEEEDLMNARSQAEPKPTASSGFDDLPAPEGIVPPDPKTPGAPESSTSKPHEPDQPVASFSTVRTQRVEMDGATAPLRGYKRGSQNDHSQDPEQPKSPKPIPVADIRPDDPEAAMLNLGDSLRPTEPQAPARGTGLPLFNTDRPSDDPNDDVAQTPEAYSLPAAPPLATAPANEAERLTLFGAREGGDRTVKPRYLGLMLSAVLLIGLVIVTGWVSLGGGLSSLFSPGAPETIAEGLPTEGATEEELAEAGTPATASTEPQDGEAALRPAPDTDPVLQTGDEPQADPDLLRPPTPQETEERYATSGIWQSAPDQPSVPPESALDDLYVASIDHPVLAFDAVALPDPTRVLTDTAPSERANPVAAGTRFDFDERGLVKPSKDGAMSPEGVLIYSGAPPAVPPKWPERQEDQGALSQPETTRLAAVRPKPRPEDLIEQTERSNLGGRTRSELAGLRPKVRPESAQAIAEAEVEEAPTEQAVLASLKPKGRPAEFAAIVKRSEPTETQPATGAIFKPQTVQPSLPSKASVARQATVKNQINLRKINLIGVYGQTRDRRALVRLSNGRYKKVQVGDRIDGGKVAAIGDDELSYVKSGRTVTLKMPRG
ncbi:Type IV pilus biogenesis [Thalassovita gelatinovora]|uniref:Type IV pilus biogenesis n=1 Tax=Thalassovita gelatinovora TaxID=53501 RepID=A0A0P1FKD1_THAGE|nr:hypothetical protein [Thalassovita gelatinovora]QIZ82332.1 hypothetical protein HFZ77_18550 [Thalassovita gelatinovora]CUH68397.1 Type IV pilus biogenesis [Thalassovita gelatinovora]SEQ51060.1 hypothetical protein SAMN04488043_1063 [Thalassovita gelatinovora]